MFSRKGMSLLFLLLADVALGIRVFLNPPASSLRTPSSLTPTQARAVVSHHLGLEAFDTLQDVQGAEQLVSGEFVGKNTGNALLLTLSEDVAPDVIPPTLKQSFSLSTPPSASSEASLVVSSYLQRAEHVYDVVYSKTSLATTSSRRVTGLIDIFTASPSYATDLFLSEASQLVELIEESLEKNEEESVFGGFELRGLSEIRKEYGRESELYKLASETTRAILESALSKPSLSFALITYPREATITHTLGARQQPPQSPLPPPAPSPQLPIGGVSTCHTSADACGNATSSCSGHGSCVEAQKAGRTCFVCACSATVDETGQRQDWAGDSCERKDVSASFVLITGTVVGILLVAFGSISILYSVGSESLPSTLVAAAGHGKRD